MAGVSRNHSGPVRPLPYGVPRLGTGWQRCRGSAGLCHKDRCTRRGASGRQIAYDPLSLLDDPTVNDRGRNQPMKQPARALVTLVKFAVSIGILVLLLRGQNLSSLQADLLTVKLEMLALAVSLLFIQTFVLCHRWILVLRAMSVSLDWLAGWRILIVSTFFNQVLPAGGDAVRILMLRGECVEMSQTDRRI